MSQGFVSFQNFLSTGSGNVVRQTSPSITTPLVTGVTDASSAGAGILGQVISSDIQIGSAVSLTTLTVANITSISLTAGDWDVFSMVGFTAGGSTTTPQVSGATSLVSATYPTDPNFITYEYPDITSPALQPQLPNVYRRMNISSTTTLYLVCRGSFSGGTLGAFGSIYARRVR